MKYDFLVSLPITAFVTLIVTLTLLDVSTVFDPPYLLPLLNTTFIAFIPFLAAYTAARTFLSVGHVTVLLLGCGMVALGMGGAISGWFIGKSTGPNTAITIYNTGVLLRALFHAAGAIFSLAAPGWKPCRNHNQVLATAYVGVVLILGGVFFLVVRGLTPPFILQGVGPTSVGRIALGSAIILFGASSVISIKHHLDTGAALIRWYAMGLALIAIGLAAVFLQKAVGSPLGWVGRSAQYAGGIYILVGVFSFYKGVYRQDMPFEAAVAAIFREAEANYKALIDTANYGIVSTDLEGRILLWNRAAENMFDFNQKNAVGALLKDLIFSGTYPAELGAWPGLSLRGSDPPVKEKPFSSILEAMVRTRDGRLFPAELSVSQRKGSSGLITTFIIKDITAGKQAEERLRLKDEELEKRNDELIRFTYAVSHDLKSPLVTIRTFLGFLEQDARKQDAVDMDKDLEYIRNATEQMSRLLDELLELSRVGRLVNPSVITPLQTIIKAAQDLVAGRIAERGVKVQGTEEPVLLSGDRSRLVEVFQNLIDNAVKFMGDQPNPRVEVGVEEAGEELVLFVRDNGLGIDQRYQPKLFGLFEKLDPRTEGAGIGLSLVQRIIEVHGGRIWVESEGLGKGACFRFTLGKNVWRSG